MTFTSGSTRAFERMMKDVPGFDHFETKKNTGVCPECKNCRFHRPQWKHQCCVYSVCPYSGKQAISTLRPVSAAK